MLPVGFEAVKRTEMRQMQRCCMSKQIPTRKSEYQDKSD